MSVGSRQTGTVKTSSEVSDSSRSTHRSAFHNWPDHPGSASCAKLGQGDGGLVQRDLTDPVPEVIRVTFHTSRAPLAHPVLAVALVAALNKHRGVGSRDFCGQRPTQPWRNPHQTASQRAAKLSSVLAQDEKIDVPMDDLVPLAKYSVRLLNSHDGPSGIGLSGAGCLCFISGVRHIRRERRQRDRLRNRRGTARQRAQRMA